MKLTRREPGRFVFVLRPVEKNLMLALLGWFPQVPGPHHRLGRNAAGTSSADPQAQELLETSIQAQREQHRAWLQAHFLNGARFQPAGKNWELQLGAEEMETLLQVFNDLRVGAWLALGSPTPASLGSAPHPSKADPRLQRLELAGWFEMILLRALHPEPTRGRD